MAEHNLEPDETLYRYVEASECLPTKVVSWCLVGECELFVRRSLRGREVLSVQQALGMISVFLFLRLSLTSL